MNPESPRANTPAAPGLGPEHRLESLFLPLSPETRALFEGYRALLHAVLPLKAAHRKELPYAIRDLSRTLTMEREGLGEDYSQSPRVLAAYLHYFLPWNLRRLAALFAGPLFDAIELDDNAVIIDCGAGPLTLVQALWIARPELRARRLTFYCVDRSKKFMRLGLDLLRGLAEAAPPAEAAGKGLPWRVHCLHEPLEKGLASVRTKADLVMAGNVLNELPWSRREPMEDQVSGLMRRIFDKRKRGEAAMTDPAEPGAGQGKVLLVEPGTRLGGRLISLSRKAGLDAGLTPLAPCPHSGPCPMLDKGTNSWCHFTFPAAHSATWLVALSEAAKLPKEDVSLSFVLLGGKDAAAKEKVRREDARRLSARVLSGAFPIPEKTEWGRYACMEGGLALLLASRAALQQLAPGDLVSVALPAKPARDRKSGAVEIAL